jgi:pimeloyl-ACP methyl ester carboxylesterase
MLNYKNRTRVYVGALFGLGGVYAMNAIAARRAALLRLIPPGNLVRPPLLKTLAEMRSIAEIGGFFACRKVLQKYAPKGDGHPVMVLPGFMTSDAFTRSLRRFLEELGYDPHPWGQGTNLGLRDETCDNIENKIAAIHRVSGRKVSLIGHSLGGFYVRCIAQRQPDLLRQIITLGTPFNVAFEERSPNSSGGALARAYDQLNAAAKDDKLPNSTMMCFPPSLPSTSIYSEGDGIVGWQHCIDIASETTENICVPGSHTGMAHNPLALHVVADRLAQSEQDWRPFNPSGLHQLLLKTACAAELFPGWLLDSGPPA